MTQKHQNLLTIQTIPVATPAGTSTEHVNTHTLNGVLGCPAGAY